MSPVTEIRVDITCRVLGLGRNPFRTGSCGASLLVFFGDLGNTTFSSLM